MPERISTRAFIRRMHDRSVWRAFVVYLGASFAVLQAIDMFTNRLRLPPWLFPVAVVLLLIGVPVVIFGSLGGGSEPIGSGVAAQAAEEKRLRLLTWRNAAAAFVAAVALWGVVLTAWLVTRAGADAADPRGADALNEAHKLVVLPFSYRGSDEFAYLGDAMVDLLSRTLDGAANVRTVDPRAVIAAARERESEAGVDAGLAIATRFHADRFVVGQIVEVGGRLRVTAMVPENSAGSTDLIETTVEGTPDSLFALVDRMTAQLLVSLVGRSATPVTRTAAITTGSLQALAAFLDGERLYRGENGRSRSRPAYDAFQRAVEIDSTFALAWYRLSQVAYFSGAALSRVTDFAETAARHASNLPWRERTLIAAHHAYARGAAVEAERRYLEILRTYPDNVEAWFGLTFLRSENTALLGGVPYAAAKQAAQRLLYYEPDNAMAVWALAYSEAHEQNWTRVDSLFRVMSNDSVPPDLAVMVAFGGGDSAAQQRMLAVYRERGSVAGKITAMHRVNWIAQNPAGAEDFARMLVRDEAPQVRALAYLRLAEFEFARGRWNAAQEAFAELRPLNPSWALVDEVYHSLAVDRMVSNERLSAWRDTLQRWHAAAVAPVVPPVQGFGVELQFTRHDGIHEQLRSYLLARLNARLGGGTTALRLAAELERLPAPANAGTLNHDLAGSIRAHVLAGRGDVAGALAALDIERSEVPFERGRASWAFTRPQDRLLRADLLASLGRNEHAEHWYQSLAYHPESVLAGLSHLRLAELYERRREPLKAAEMYRRLIHLWSDADPELQPTVHTARTRLRHDAGGHRE